MDKKKRENSLLRLLGKIITNHAADTKSSAADPISLAVKKMNIKEAKKNIGKLVMSRDPGHKMIKSVAVPHGPYKLLKITKGGLAILEGRDGHGVAPSLLSKCGNDSL